MKTSSLIVEGKWPMFDKLMIGERDLLKERCFRMELNMSANEPPKLTTHSFLLGKQQLDIEVSVVNEVLYTYYMGKKYRLEEATENDNE